MKEISFKFELLGYIEFHFLYLKVTGELMVVGMVDIKKEFDLTKMLEYSKTNNYITDLYVKHFFS